MSDELKGRIMVAIANGESADELIALLEMISDLQTRVTALENA